MPTRLKHWRKMARHYQRLLINSISLAIVGLCVIALIEMMWTTTPIVFDVMAAWIRAVPEFF
jgi:hypothetical protein